MEKSPVVATIGKEKAPELLCRKPGAGAEPCVGEVLECGDESPHSKNVRRKRRFSTKHPGTPFTFRELRFADEMIVNPLPIC
jgi:hypothetical protein